MMWISDLALSCLFPLLALSLASLPRLWETRQGVELGASLRLAAAAALALLALQAGGMLLGFTGLLHAGLVAAWIAGCFALGAWGWWKLGAPPWARGGLLPADGERPAGLSAWLCLAAGALALLYLLQATVPPWYRDSLVYHLALPRFFAQAGGYAVPDDNVFAAFPLGWESILALLHALGPAPDRDPLFNPRLLGAWTTLGAALATAGLVRSAGGSRGAGALAGLLLLLVPTVYEFGTSTYVEPYLILLSTLAIAGVLRIQRGETAAGIPAAIFAGAAASVKYPGLAVAAFLGLLIVLSGFRREPEEQREALRRGLGFGLLALAVAAPFYLRNWILRGNPFFPMAYGLFGGAGWDDWRDLHYGITLIHYGMGRELFDWLLLPFRLFTTLDMRAGFEGSLGPVVGLGAVGGLLLRRRTEAPRAVALLFAFLLLWFGFWAFTVQQVRFFLVAVPPLLALLALWLDRPAGGIRPAAAGALVLVALAWLASPAGALWKRQHTGEWLAGSLDRDALLSRMLPDTFVPMKELEQLVPEDGKVWLVWMRGYTYYLRRPYRYDAVFEGWRLEALLDAADRPEAAAEQLRGEGFTHLLIHHDFFLQGENADLQPRDGRTERLRRRFQALLTTGEIRPVREWGPVRLYATGAREALVGD